MNDFSGHPVSLGERRAEREMDCSKWSPRDLLISMLREIDSGEIQPDAMIVAYRLPEGGGNFLNMTCFSAPDADVALGILMRAQNRMMCSHE